MQVLFVWSYVVSTGFEGSNKISLSGRNFPCWEIWFSSIAVKLLTIRKYKAANFLKLFTTAGLYYYNSSDTSGGSFSYKCDEWPHISHAQGCTAPFIKEVKDEYLRLIYHNLPTIIVDISGPFDVAVLDRDKNHTNKFMVNVMTSCLTYRRGIFQFTTLVCGFSGCNPDSEGGWIRGTINNFQLVHQLPCERRACVGAMNMRNDYFCITYSDRVDSIPSS